MTRWSMITGGFDSEGMVLPAGLFQHHLTSSAIAISAPVDFFLFYPVKKAKDDGYDRRANEEIEKKFYQQVTPCEH